MKGLKAGHNYLVMVDDEMIIMKYDYIYDIEVTGKSIYDTGKKNQARFSHIRNFEFHYYRIEDLQCIVKTIYIE